MTQPSTPAGSLADRARPVVDAIHEGKVQLAELRFMDLPLQVDSETAWAQRPHPLPAAEFSTAAVQRFLGDPAQNSISLAVSGKVAVLISKKPVLDAQTVQESTDWIASLAQGDSGVENFTPGHNPWLD